MNALTLPREAAIALGYKPITYGYTVQEELRGWLHNAVDQIAPYPVAIVKNAEGKLEVWRKFRLHETQNH